MTDRTDRTDWIEAFEEWHGPRDRRWQCATLIEEARGYVVRSFAREVYPSAWGSTGHQPADADGYRRPHKDDPHTSGGWTERGVNAVLVALRK